jgi:hypothetical protein
VANLAGELKDKAGAVAIRYGVGMTGNHAGNVALFQGYEDLDGVDRAFDVYAGSSDYVEAMASGKVQVQFRNIWQLDTSVGYGDSSATTPKYGVVTRFRSSDPMTETMQELSGVLKDNGALTMRYGTLLTGDNVGMRLAGVTYPSMSAIQKGYEALGANKAFQEALGTVDLDLRNVIKFVA